MFVKAAAQARDISVLYLLTISKRYQQPVDILGVGVYGRQSCARINSGIVCQRASMMTPTKIQRAHAAICKKMLRRRDNNVNWQYA
jgi:hypothetical protein